MLKNYFIIGLRNLLNQKGYSAIKIAGLAFGLAASLTIYLYILEDFSYDKFNKNYDNIARLLLINNSDGVSSKVIGMTAPAFGPAAEEEFPEVINSVRLWGGGSSDLSYGDHLVKCNAGFGTESSFFKIFDFEILEGKKEKTLEEPNSIAITETLARKLFGDENPIGKTVRLNETEDLHVVALVKDIPENSHIQFDLLRSLTPPQNDEGSQQYLQTWQSRSIYTYLLLDQPLDTASLNPRLRAMWKENGGAEFLTPLAQSLRDVHLKSKEILYEVNANKSDIINVYVLSIIASLILILAIVNFVNLVTANSLSRAKEVGMRKVIGARRSQLIGQHLIESIVVTTAGALFAICIVFLIIPVLNNVYQRFADPMILLGWNNLLAFGGLIFVLSLLAGLYPAFVLSSFKPVLVLKGAFTKSKKGNRLRQALVIVQFTISIALMAGTGIIYKQMNFIYAADLGYNREQVITLTLNAQVRDKTPVLKEALLQNQNIVTVGSSTMRLGQRFSRIQIYPEGVSNETDIMTSVMAADESFIPTLGIQVKDGRNFSLHYNDSLSMIINEEMVRLLKWNDAIGRKISLQSGPNPTDLTAYTVVGVIRDFHFATIRHKIEPLFILFDQTNGSLSIKVKEQEIQETLTFIETTWKKMNPGSTFTYAFLDDQFANQYRSEQSFATMFTHFTVLAMVIAALGLFAFSAFTVEQRRKEIGIRKVLGAGTGTILYKVSVEFIQLIFVAFVFAGLITYVTMDKWLSEFQYRVEINSGIFVLTAALSVGIAMLTISFHAMKAAWSNPVNSLKDE